MRKAAKPTFFVVLALILALTYTAFFGVYKTIGDDKITYIKGAQEIRWGIDIRGGVNVTFSPPEGIDATEEQLDAAESIIKVRLLAQNITDAEVYKDQNNDRIIVRFPWKEGETEFDPEAAIEELGATALLTFREGVELDANGKPTGVTEENIILTGADVESAGLSYDESGRIAVALTLKDSGKQAFAEATTRLAETNGQISIWMDDTLISAPQVNSAITDGQALITNSQFTVEEAKELADKINGGALPFKLETSNFSSISPTLGQGARDVMIQAGVIAYILVALIMIVMYRLPGTVAAIALLGQAAGTIAAISGYLPTIPSFTLTLPGIAGIVLAIGMGVDANVITAERIKEELRNGKTLDSAINIGFKRAWSAILDGNVTVVIVSIILMGAFGPPESLFAKIFTPIFFMFGPSTAGTVYSFGYTLLVGVILNMVFGVLCSKLMLRSISQFKAFRGKKLYGGVDE